MRRRLLVDPHIAKDGINSRNLAVDNPLSLNPSKILLPFAPENFFKKKKIREHFPCHQFFFVFLNLALHLGRKDGSSLNISANINKLDRKRKKCASSSSSSCSR